MYIKVISSIILGLWLCSTAIKLRKIPSSMYGRGEGVRASSATINTLIHPSRHLLPTGRRELLLDVQCDDASTQATKAVLKRRSSYVTIYFYHESRQQNC